MSRIVVRAARADWGSVAPPAGPESADLNFPLLATLAACLAFWVLVSLSLYWLI